MFSARLQAAVRAVAAAVESGATDAGFIEQLEGEGGRAAVGACTHNRARAT
jgi:hypothetical protein